MHCFACLKIFMCRWNSKIQNEGLLVMDASKINYILIIYYMSEGFSSQQIISKLTLINQVH